MADSSTAAGEKNYDYIISGMGCAGLSLAIHLVRSGKFADKRILLVDKDDKRENDRTWCFWETGSGLFEQVVHHRWNKLWFHASRFSRLLHIDPYTYKLIRGEDFYRYCLSVIRQQSNIEIRKGTVEQLVNESNGATVMVDGKPLTCHYAFNSILFEKPVLKEKEHYLLQHFKGWLIETSSPRFNSSEATLMDFRTGQEQGTTFVYVMPFSATTALVEYTLFTKELLEHREYDEGLEKYISQWLKIDDYTVKEEEFGIIPMTNHLFPAVNGHIINIGTAGGQTKASSGYTFQFIQKHSARLVESLVKKKNPFIARPAGPRRFRFYDSVLLNILANNKLPGDKVFAKLFQKNKPQQVLRFLDNESSYMDELKIISSLPTLPFLKAAYRQF